MNLLIKNHIRISNQNKDYLKYPYIIIYVFKSFLKSLKYINNK